MSFSAMNYLGFMAFGWLAALVVFCAIGAAISRALVRKIDRVSGFVSTMLMILTILLLGGYSLLARVQPYVDVLDTYVIPEEQWIIVKGQVVSYEENNSKGYLAFANGKLCHGSTFVLDNGQEYRILSCAQIQCGQYVRLQTTPLSPIVLRYDIITKETALVPETLPQQLNGRTDPEKEKPSVFNWAFELAVGITACALALTGIFGTQIDTYLSRKDRCTGCVEPRLGGLLFFDIISLPVLVLSINAIVCEAYLYLILVPVFLFPVIKHTIEIWSHRLCFDEAKIEYISFGKKDVIPVNDNLLVKWIRRGRNGYGVEICTVGRCPIVFDLHFYKGARAMFEFYSSTE